MIEVQPMFIVHDMPHEIVNNNSPLSINIVGKCKRSIAGLMFRPWCRSCFFCRRQENQQLNLSPTKP